MDELKFAVIGNPVSHSLSPDIHLFFASQFQLEHYTYNKIKSNENDFERDINDFFKNGGVGLNVTVPFKGLAYNLCDELDQSAGLCKSVNTVLIDSGKLIGHSTDGQGLIDDFLHKEITLEDSKILIIGAGGSAASIISSLLFHGKIKEISILNRTKSNALRLLDLFETNRLLMHEEGDEYDIVINTTPISMNVDDIILPPELIINKPICYDLFYDKEKTLFQKWAEKNESTVNYDGLGMLIHQAKHSFKIWNNLSPDIDGLEELLRRD